VDTLETQQYIPTTPLQPRPAGCLVPLTFDQMNHWKYVELQKPSLSVRLRTAATRILGPLDVAALRDVLEHIVERHESLRTRIIKINGVPYHHIDPWGGELRILEVERMNEETNAQNCAEAFFQQRIDLSVGPLFGAMLLSLSATYHVLLLALDHIVGDGVSNAILTRELWTAYSQVVQQRQLTLPHLPVQFADYALWRHQTCELRQATHEAYWTERLSTARRVAVPVDLPGGRLEDEVEGELLHHPLGKGLSAELRALAQREHVPLSGVVLTIYAAAMAEWCHTQDLLLGFVSHGRHGRPELENMVGCLSRTTYLRIFVGVTDSLYELLKKTHHELLSALRHEDFVPPLPPESATELLFSWGGLSAHSARRFADARRSAVPGLRLQPFPTRSRWPHKLLTFFTDTPASIVITASYRPDLFRPESIVLFCGNLQRVAHELVRQPYTRLASLGLVAR